MEAGSLHNTFSDRGSTEFLRTPECINRASFNSNRTNEYFTKISQSSPFTNDNFSPNFPQSLDAQIQVSLPNNDFQKKAQPEQLRPFLATLLKQSAEKSPQKKNPSALSKLEALLDEADKNS